MGTELLLAIARETIAQVTWCFAISAAEGGEINARLVQIGALAEDWTVQFMTDRRCRKIAEIERSGRLTLAYQHNPDRAYVTLVGRAVVIGDSEAKRAIWRPDMQRFHPGGPEDPNNVIVRFTTDRIEMYSGARDVAPEPKGFSAAMLTRTASGWGTGCHLPAGGTAALIRIVPGDHADPRVAGLLRTHLATARAQTAPGSAHALDLSGLRSPEVSLWAAWEGETLLGVGALKRLSPEHGPDHGEVKSMHTAEAARRKGVGGALLRHIIAAARESGLSRLSLETGSWPYFQPAQALYRRHGFVDCPPFADYAPDPNSVFMSLDLRRS